MRTLYKILLGFIPLLLGAASHAQSITTTGLTYTNCGTAPACYVTFVVNNAGTTGILLNSVSSYSDATNSGNTVTLHYSSTSVSGPLTGTSVFPGAAWTQIASQTVGTITTTGINPAISGLSFLIPAGTQYRFLLQYSGTTSYDNSQTINSWTNGSVSVYTGNYQIAGQGVGYAGGNYPRTFTGTINYTPAVQCAAPIAGGTTVASPINVCAGNPTTINANNATVGTGLTYQLLSATSIGGPYTAVGAAQGSTQFTANPTVTTFYRVRAVCNAGGVDTSTPVQVTVPALFPGGTYTIDNSQPTSGTNFNSFTAAAAAIACGTAGPVVFNVANNATPYNEQITLPHIATLSSANTVTFNGNGATISFSSPAAQPAVITLNGTDWVRIKRLNIRGLSSTSTGVQMINDANNIVVDSCNITLDTTSTNTTIGGINISGSLTSVTTSGSNCDSITLTNNNINGGYSGISLMGAAAQLSTGNVIARNTVRNFYVYGMYTLYLNATDIDENEIHRLTRATVSTFYGVFVGTGSLGTRVRKNRIHDPSAVSPTTSNSSYVIYHSSADGTAASPNEVSNNVVYNFRQAGLIYALYNVGSDYVRYYHNTISLDDSGATSTTGVARGFFQSTVASNIELKNNIISVRRNTSGVKHILYFGTAGTTYSARNNVYFLTAPGASGGIVYYNNATNYPTLAPYQAATMQDTGSVEGDPLFTAPASGNLLPTAGFVNNMGTAVGIPTDILNNPRGLVNPDPGAYEIGTPSCPAPTALTAANVTASTANLSWAPVLGATGFQYAVTTSATPPASGTATTATSNNPTGLTGSTTYYLHVRLECSPGSFSPWSTISFTTGCASVNTTVTSSGATTFCAGSAVTLTAATGTGYSYQWKLDGNNIPNATSISYTATIAGSYTVLVTSSATCSAASAPVVVTVNPLPPNTATSGSTNLCTGNSLIIAGPPGAGLTYQWFNGATIIPGATSQNYSATAAGSYTVVVSNGTCSATSSPIVITANTPLVIATTPGSRCDSGVVSLSATGSTGTTVLWYANPTGGPLLATGSPFTTPNITSNTTYYAAASTGTGGSNNSIVTSTTSGTSGSGTGGLMFDINANTALTIDSVTASFATAGAQTFSVYVRSGTHCGFQTSATGWTLVSTGTVTPPTTGINVFHTFALATPVSIPTGVTGVYFYYNARYETTTSCSSFSVSNADMTITAGTAHTGLFTSTLSRRFAGTLIYSKGCESPRVPVLATVSPLPPANASASGATTVCQGETVTLNGGAGSQYTYQWQNNGADIAGATSPTYLAGTSGNYAVVVSDGLCIDTSADVAVTVNPAPNAAVTPPGPVAFCDGGNVPLTGNVGNGLSYVWLQSGLPIPGANGSFYVVTGSGDYALVVTENNCSDTSALIVATENPLPVPIINASGPALSTTAYASYQWYRNGAPIAGATSQTYTATQNGAYTVTVIDANGCSGTSGVTNVTSTSVGQVAGAAAIRVFPNPTTGVLFIQSKTAVNATVWTMDGRKLMEVVKAEKVDLNGLPAGVYMLRLADAKGTPLLTERVTKLD